MPENAAVRLHEQLLEAACAGDPSALADLMAEYRSKLYRYGRRVCASDADADDAVQEALSALRGSLPGVRKREALSGFLFEVVRNACRRMLRPTSTRDRLEHLLHVAEQAVTPQDQLEHAQLIAAVQAALRTLDAPFREVLLLRDLEGYSGHETAQRLGLTLEATKSRLHRARRALKAAIEAPLATVH